MAVVATAGWIRQPIAVVPSHFNAPQLSTEAAAPLPAPAVPAVQKAVETRQSPSAITQVARRTRASGPQRILERQGYERYEDTRTPETVIQKRSTKASAAIVGGSAAAGAAVGAIAGGGKGAAIGALTGGAAGLVYDRMTHKKEVPADEVYGSENERSLGKTAAIVGGGSAAGAAIGAVAGGGKGAAIGAITGGAAGLIYDRVTR
jgi:hypothetical protein